MEQAADGGVDPARVPGRCASIDQTAPRGRNIDQNSRHTSQRSPEWVAGVVRRIILTTTTQPITLATRVKQPAASNTPAIPSAATTMPPHRTESSRNNSDHLAESS